MRKKIAALIICISLIAAAVPLYAADHSSPRFNLGRFITKQALNLAALFRIVPNYNYSALETIKVKKSNQQNQGRVETTGQLDIVRIGGGD